jgi:hypothetical protein
MFNAIQRLLPDVPVLANYKLSMEERKLETKKGLRFYEFDVSTQIDHMDDIHKVFLPSLALAIEYQGETHYFSGHLFGQASNRQRADKIKHSFATSIGITLISVPYWWDKSPNSLAATIQYYRPDITISVPSKTLPIPSHMPMNFQRQFRYVPNSSKEYKEQINPTGW